MLASVAQKRFLCVYKVGQRAARHRCHRGPAGAGAMEVQPEIARQDPDRPYQNSMADSVALKLVPVKYCIPFISPEQTEINHRLLSVPSDV
jgi:hypothetical protein